MKKINIRESLINMDRETDCKYDLTSLYESCKLDDEKKKELCQYIDKVDIEATNRFLSNEAASQGLMENASDDIADEELNEWFDDDWHEDNESTFEYIASKSVPDADGFYTDYTWYRNVDTDQHIFVFGDSDIYKPEHGDSDYECGSQEEAQQWFDSYNGIEESLNEANYDHLADIVPFEIIPDSRPKKYFIGEKEVPYTSYEEAKKHIDEFDITSYRDELNQFLADKGLKYIDVDVTRRDGKDVLYVDIHNGDWKQEHVCLQNAMWEFFINKGLIIGADKQQYGEDDGSDNYSAEYFFDIKDICFSERPVKESLEKTFKPGDRVFCKATKKVGTVKSLKGDNVEVEFTGGDDPDRIDTYYKQDLQLKENFEEIQQQAMEDDADQDEMRDYIDNVYIDVLDELEAEYEDFFLESNVQGDQGSIDVFFTKDDVEYYATWDYNDELIDLADIFFDAASEEDFKANLKNFLESKLAAAKPQDEIDESVKEKPAEEELVESIKPTDKRTLDEGWFSDDDFEDDMMHTDIYGGDSMYCRDCGSKLDYSNGDGYGFCPKCDPQDELEYVGEESIVEGAGEVDLIDALDIDTARFYVYDAEDNIVSDPFEWFNDAIDFADENNYPTVKVHRYFRDFSNADWFVGDEDGGRIYHGEDAAYAAFTDLSKTYKDTIMEPVEGEEGKLQPDGDPVVVYKDGQVIKKTYTTEALEEDKVNKFVLMGVKEDNSKHYYKKESNEWVAKASDATVFDDRNSAVEVWSDIDKKDFDKVSIMIKPEELDEDLEDDLETRYTVRKAHTDKSVLANVNKILRSELVASVEPVTMYDNQLFKMTAADGRTFFLVPCTLSQFDVYDEQENLIVKSEFASYIANEILSTGDMQFTYKVVGGDYAGDYNREELEALPCFGGLYTEDESRPKLNNQPVLDGYLSPMVDGWKDNKIVIRYETQEVYDMMSEATDLSSKKGTLGNLIASNNDTIKSFTTKEEIINFLIDIEPQCTNKEYLNKVKMDIIHSKNFTRAMQYLYDAMLKGDGLGSIENEAVDENWALFATDESTGQEYCAGVYGDQHDANYWAAMDKHADAEYQYGNFKYRVEQVPEYTQELLDSYRELNNLKLANHSAAEEKLRSTFDKSLTEAKTGIPYKGYTICYGCHGTDRWYVKDSYGEFLGTKSGYSTEEEATEYIDDELDECFISESVNEAVAPDGYEPKKKGTAYKVFKVKNGKLYPPMVANPGGADTPVGVWLTADEGEFAGLSKTGRPQVKSIGSGTLSYRPGWHLGDIPRASQFDRTNKETGEKEFPKDFVWAECEYTMDIDYQPESDEQGYMRIGKDGKQYRSDKYQHSLAGLPKLPKDGYYKYRTNPRPDTVPWVITGAIKVNRLLSDAEVNDILASKGIDPIHRQGGDKTLAELGL